MDILEPGFRQIFFNQYAQIPTTYDKIFHVLKSTKQDEYDSSVSGFGRLVETTEGAPVTYENLLQEYDTYYTHKKYTKGFQVTREMWEDDQYGVMKKAPAALALTTVRTVENVTGDIFDNAFTSGTGGDGKYLCDTEHPRIDGGTAISNVGTSALDEDGIETALVAMRGTLDGKGQKILVRPDTLLIPKELELETAVLMKSTGRTGTNYNEINAYQGRFNVIVWDYLDNTKQWYLLDSGLHELNFFWRIRPEFSQDESFDTDAALYKVRARWSQGWSDWRGVYGSTGTA